jgi:hypothetical protein
VRIPTSKIKGEKLNLVLTEFQNILKNKTMCKLCQTIIIFIHLTIFLPATDMQKLAIYCHGSLHTCYNISFSNAHIGVECVMYIVTSIINIFLFQ